MGIDPDRLDGPIVGIASTWTRTMPCNLNHRRLALKVAEAVEAAGGVALEFNTIAVSDNQSQATPGMRASLVSREVIADSIELMVHAHDFDSLVCLVGCDKTVPAALMALARVDRPAVVLSGGPMLAGRDGDRALTIQDVWEAVGAHDRGRITREQLDVVEREACPGAGYCAGNFTANTMAIVVDMLGLGVIGDGLIPAAHIEEKDAAAAARRVARGPARRERHDRPALPRPPRARERDGRRGRQRRLDQRLPPPAGDRARGGRRRSASTSSPPSARARRCWPTSCRAGASWRRTCTRRAARRR